MTVYDLPAVNATLNAISAVLLMIGYVMIRQRRIEQHRKYMIAASWDARVAHVFDAKKLVDQFLGAGGGGGSCAAAEPAENSSKSAVMRMEAPIGSATS